MGEKKARMALISVSNKEGVAELGRELIRLGFHLVSTGGTARFLEQSGVKVERVEELTGFPEILNGRVKTLHPKIHAGILARDLPEDREQVERLDIHLIDLVVVNLYPFRETVANPDVTLAEAIEQIDIGGPTIIRAAAKNFARVAVVVNPERYPEILKELREKGEICLATRFKLAQEAFSHTASYDAAISNFLTAVDVSFGEEPEFSNKVQLKKFPANYTLSLVMLQELRYGENPHQQAAFYREETVPPYGLAGARQVQGKELSFNNILDLNAALRIVSEFKETAAVVIKHNTPSGVACASELADAYVRARQADPVAAFGGVVGLNRTVDKKTAERLVETFLEAVIAPGFSEDALAVLSDKKNMRLLSTEGLLNLDGKFDVKRVSGGFLVQDFDADASDRFFDAFKQRCRVVTKKAPSESEWEDLFFGWLVVKHVFSNGIVLAREKETVGIGGGQVSRVDAARIALAKAGDKAHGSVLASDGFLPFPDTIEYAVKCGIKAIVQPGGSLRDEEVIEAADAAGIAMIFTGQRHFKH